MSMFSLLFKLSRRSRFINKVFSIIFSCNIPYKTKIGKNVIFNHRALGVVLHPNAIIGNDVYIEHHVLLGQRTGNNNNAPIIEDNVVIGAYAIILGGVKVGKGSVIGAGSLVLDDIPPETLFYNERVCCYKRNSKPKGQY